MMQSVAAPESWHTDRRPRSGAILELKQAIHSIERRDAIRFGHRRIVERCFDKILNRVDRWV